MVSRRLALSLPEQGDVHADKIRLSQRFFERYVLDPRLLFLDATRLAQVHRLLNCFYIFMVLIRRVVAENIHVEPSTLLDHRQTDAPCADDCDRLASYFVSQKRQIRMPEAPLVFAGQVFGWPQLARYRSQHEEGEFCCRLGENVGGISERNLVTVRIRAIDVVKTDSKLRDNFQRVLAGLKDFCVNLIPQCRDQAVDSRTRFFDDHTLRWGRGIGINFELITPFAQQIESLANVTSDKNAKIVCHSITQTPNASRCSQTSSPTNRKPSSAEDRIPARLR